jgi:putative spermidine/putrescine transport system permease protein
MASLGNYEEATFLAQSRQESYHVEEFSTGKLKQRGHFRWWRFIVLTVAAAYFLIPLFAGIRFSLQNTVGRFSFRTVEALPSAPGFSAAFWLSMRVTIVTVLISAALMVPTAIYVHVRVPKMRRVLDFVTVLPIVIPPIILIVGVLFVAPVWLKSSPYLLSLMYVILAMPFVYRSLDAGLGAIDLKTLTEASRSLGGNWAKTMWSVVMPNLRSGLMSALVLTLALALGEFTMASLDLWETIPVWIVSTNGLSNGHIEIAAAMIGLVGACVLVALIVSLDRSKSARGKVGTK